MDKFQRCSCMMFSKLGNKRAMLLSSQTRLTDRVYCSFSFDHNPFNKIPSDQRVDIAAIEMAEASMP